MSYLRYYRQYFHFHSLVVRYSSVPSSCCSSGIFRSGVQCLTSFYKVFLGQNHHIIKDEQVPIVVNNLLVFQLSSFFDKPIGVIAQEPAFELPVELVGFPVIIVAVRLSNFVKKLAYSLNPKTYTSSRTKRELASDELLNMLEAEKKLISEFGENVCIYPKVCLYHAEKAGKSRGQKEVNVDWNEIFSNYKSTNEKQKEFYLLSVFLGDFIASPKFCNQLVKRGRVCVE